MLTTPHALAGAAIGSLMPSSIAGCAGGFVIGFVSHFVLDSMPHWERIFVTKNHTELAKKGYTLRDTGVYVQVVFDAALAGILVYFAAKHVGGGQVNIFSGVLWGAIGAALPDLLDNVHPINKRLKRFSLFKLMDSLHRHYHINFEAQRRLPKYTGLMTQLLVILLSLAALR